jgi:hypothetical protein
MPDGFSPDLVRICLFRCSWLIVATIACGGRSLECGKHFDAFDSACRQELER